VGAYPIAVAGYQYREFADDLRAGPREAAVLGHIAHSALDVTGDTTAKPSGTALAFGSARVLRGPDFPSASKAPYQAPTGGLLSVRQLPGTSRSAWSPFLTAKHH
jgi:hypothetical protein